MNARGKGSNSLMARGAVADIEAFCSLTLPVFGCSMITDIVWSSHFDSFPGFLSHAYYMYASG